MKRLYLNSFASLANKRNEKSLMNAINKMVATDNDTTVFWYSRIRPGVKSFFVRDCDYGILDGLLNKLSHIVPQTSFQKNDIENSKQAIQLMKGMSFKLLEGKNMIQPTDKCIPFYGIELFVNPDAIISWEDKKGVKHFGAIKTKIKKGPFNHIEGTTIACILQYYLTVLYPDCVVEPDYCICFDVFRRNFFTSKNYNQNIHLAASLANRIAAAGEAAA